MSDMRVLVINSGNTSTKVGLFRDEATRVVESIKHSDADLAPFASINDQREFRERAVFGFLESQAVEPRTLSAIAARGGLLKPVPSGTYRVNPEMVKDSFEARRGAHASNLAAQIGFSMGEKLSIPCYIVDPVSVDELEPIARYSGHRLFQRVMLTHALNMKAVARRFARERGVDYASLNLVVVHLGTGVSLTVHRGGRMVDSVNSIEEGCFSPDRSGGLPLMQVARYIIDNKLSYADFERMMFGNGGLYSYLGSRDFLAIKERYLAGEAEVVAVVDAMAYQTAKEIGSLATVVNGRLDAVLLTGGMAYNDFLVELIRRRVAFLAPLHVYPGEDEMQSLAEGVFRVLRGEETARVY
jgi:butyrate kinase